MKYQKNDQTDLSICSQKYKLIEDKRCRTASDVEESQFKT